MIRINARNTPIPEMMTVLRRLPRTPVGSEEGSTRRDPSSGVLTTDLKKAPTAEEAYDERDSGTGDSKKSNDAEYEEGIPLMMEGDGALFPRRRQGQRIPPPSPSPPPQQLQKAQPQDLVQVRHGGGESRMSLTEFGDIPFDDDADDSGSGSPGSVVSGSGSDDQGGGEGQCDVEAGVAAAVDSSSTSDADTTTATSNTAKSEKSKAAAGTEEETPPFRTFHPRGRRQRQISEVVMNNASCADLVAAAAMSPPPSSMKKRASTVELNGKCYLAIEPETRDARTAMDPLEPSVYRGGAGTVPRNRQDQLKLTN